MKIVFLKGEYCISSIIRNPSCERKAPDLKSKMRETCSVFSFRPDTQHRGPAAHSENDLPEQEEEILGSDDDEQEDPNDYCKGENFPVYGVVPSMESGRSLDFSFSIVDRKSREFLELVQLSPL